MMNRLIVRADGNSSIGFGHVMRSLALVNGIDFNEVHWFSLDDIDAILKRDSRTSVQFHRLSDEEEFNAFLKNTDVVLLDGYQFTRKDHQRIKSVGAKLILIDDLANQPVSADLIINPTPGFRSNVYVSDRISIFLMGMNYALLRSPFLTMAKKAELNKVDGSVLICMGGSDPMNFTERILEVTLAESFHSIHIVVGSGYRFHATLERFNDQRIQVHQELNAEEMAELMAKCEWGIYPSSGILLEGLAAQQQIISGITAENQRFVYDAHVALNTVIDAKDFSSIALKEAFKKRSSSETKQHPIDGKSIDRISKVIQLLIESQHFTLRTATEDDLMQTFQWAKDPAIRAFAFQQHEISMEEHTAWFRRKVSDPSCFYYIMEENGRSLGSIRFDVNDDLALISYLIDPSQHGKGLGLFLLKMGMEQVLTENRPLSFNKFVGEVMPENKGSVRIFEQLGFEMKKTNKALHFSKNCTNYVQN